MSTSGLSQAIHLNKKQASSFVFVFVHILQSLPETMTSHTPFCLLVSLLPGLLSMFAVCTRNYAHSHGCLHTLVLRDGVSFSAP